MAKHSSTNKKCMTEGCESKGTGPRDLCPNCYGYARQLIARGQTTWSELESLGLCGGKAVKPKPFITAFEKAMAVKTKRDERRNAKAKTVPMRRAN